MKAHIRHVGHSYEFEYYEAYVRLPKNSPLREVVEAAHLVERTLKEHRLGMRYDASSVRVEGVDAPYAGCIGIEVVLDGSWEDKEVAAGLRCAHLADDTVWSEGLESAPCPRCGRYYVD